MANKYLPHIHVIPEDDANRQIALSLLLELGLNPNRYQVFPPARGWSHVIQSFELDHAANMDRFPEQFIILLIDFDEDTGRLEYAKSRIPPNLADRVFILGAWSKPEDLKQQFGNFDEIGSALARDCQDQTSAIWGHDLLQNNANELQRVQTLVCPLIM
jgi:hypothetical protein